MAKKMLKINLFPKLYVHMYLHILFFITIIQMYECTKINSDIEIIQ